MTRVLVPSGALGLGYDRAALARGIAMGPDIIAIDGGSTDSGPHYLGTGTSKYSRATTKAEWSELIAARAEAKCPLLLGTAGTCGSDSAVDWLLDITREIAAERDEKLKIALLKSEQDGIAIARAFNDGRINALPAAPEITAQTFEKCTHIVALAGAEQIQAALDTGADIVIAGRTTDTAVLSALPLRQNCHAGAVWHGAKVGECGALATTHSNTGVILLDFDEEGCTITPLAEGSAATPETVSAHMLYENSDPFTLYEPGGYLDTKGAKYQPVGNATRITGSEWHATRPYTVKLEGARRAGFQTVSLVLVREPRYVANIRAWCADVEAKCTERAATRVAEPFTIELRLIGVDATLGPLEPTPKIGHEVGVLGIVTASDEAASREVAKILNPYLLHHPLTENEPMPTFAFPFSPPEMPRGEVYEFCLNHVLELSDPMEAFRLEVVEVGP
ncbi:MAG: acyclic terpene utilization AtuA family protein [Pseudomonadota bacterium]